MRKENIYIKSLHTSAVKPRDCGGASKYHYPKTYGQVPARFTSMNTAFRCACYLRSNNILSKYYSTWPKINILP